MSGEEVWRVLGIAAVPASVRPLLQAAARVGRQREVPVYAVGGCVRDWLLRIPSLDIDLVVEGDGVAYARALGAAMKARIVEHGAFGTATLTCADKRRIDVATARTERYRQPAAYPSVEPGSIEQDLGRRDFTINAMAIRLGMGKSLMVVDPCGGRGDLEARHIRALHVGSFMDDPTRIFRAARFAQRFGFAIEPMTERWIREAVRAGMLERVQRGRVRKELVRMADEPSPWACVQRLVDLVA